MKRDITLLVSSAGRRVALLECFRADASHLGLNLRLIATDMHPKLSAACTFADVAFAVPACTDPSYPEFLYNLCKREGVDLVVPTIDTELPYLADVAALLGSSGTRAVVSEQSVVSLARDKYRTAKDLQARGISTPRTMKLSNEALRENWSWPVIIKPNSGSSSKGVRIINRGEFEEHHLTEEYIIQEFLEGPEYTVNMFFDKDGNLRCAIPHLRIETRSGEVSKGETSQMAVLEDMAWRLGKVLTGARGPICFQAIVVESGAASIFEINARFGGGFPLSHKAGARFTRWLLEEASGLALTADNNWQSGVRMLRYDAAVFS